MASGIYFIHYLRRWQENNNDVFLINASEKGLGKSTLSIHLARDYIQRFGFICPHCGNEFYKNLYKVEKVGNSYRFYIPDSIKSNEVRIKCPEYYELDIKTGVKKKISGCGETFVWSERKRIKWSAAKFIAYDNGEARTKILNMPRYSPLIFDEAMNFMAAQDHNKVESKEMKKLITVVRPRRLFMIANIPELMWVDSKYRDIFAHFWIYAIEKGHAFIFEKNKAVTKDKWGLKYLEKHMGVVKYFTNTDKIKRSIKRHPCYFDSISWSELPEKVYNDYEYVRNARNLQRQVEEMELSNLDIGKIMAWNLLNEWDRIQLEVNKSKGNKMTYNILRHEILINPVTRKPMSSETTVRNWVIGMEQYLKTKGQNSGVFAPKGL